MCESTLPSVPSRFTEVYRGKYYFFGRFIATKVCTSCSRTRYKIVPLTKLYKCLYHDKCEIKVNKNTNNSSEKREILFLYIFCEINNYWYKFGHFIAQKNLKSYWFYKCLVMKEYFRCLTLESANISLTRLSIRESIWADERTFLDVY